MIGSEGGIMLRNQWETIISVAAEGGSIKLLGKEQSPGQWVFRKLVNEIQFDDLEDEAINSSSHDRIDYEARVVNKSWEEALQILDRYPWHKLSPREVHPGFRKQLWAAFQAKRKGDPRSSSHRPTRWLKVCFPDYSQKIVKLAEWLQQANHTTILTGAGMSTESNIPDFRSKEGWWKNIDPLMVATTEALANNYDLFHEFYSVRLKALEGCSPHKGHDILADWERKGFIQAIATQNVDGLHPDAGSRNVYELHGSIHKIRCQSCGINASIEQFYSKVACSHCGGKLRPGVVLFGEILPEDIWSASLSHIRKSDLVIVIGTSLEVYPASQLPQMTEGKTVYINIESNVHGTDFDLVINGKAGEVLGQVDDLLF